jgi:predicted ABC-type ATPase
VIAGPNGAGKTTFARRYLPENVGVVHFVNADLIASGLSPLKPELAAIAAARIVLRDRPVGSNENGLRFETTLSELTHVSRLRALKRSGYRIEIIYLRLRSPRLAVSRVAARVRQGGHDVPKHDVIRRFSEAGRTFIKSIGCWRTAGLCTTIQANAPRLLERSP